MFAKVMPKKKGLTMVTFAPMARLEGVRVLWAYATYKKLKLYQIDVKYAFLNRNLKKRSTLNNQKDFLNLIKRTWNAS